MQIVVQGLGQLGRSCIELGVAHPDVDVVAVLTRRPAEAHGIPDGVRVLDSLEEAARLFPGSVVLHATHALGAELAEVLGEVARLGLDVVTSSALFDPEVELDDHGEALDRVARDGGARVVAAGVQPGLVLDVLPATVLDLAPGWLDLTVTKPSDSRQWPVTTRHMLGIGEDPAVVAGSVPVSLEPSARLIAGSAGYHVEGVSESRTAAVADEDLALADEKIPAGRAIGFRQECVAGLEGGRTVRVVWEPRLDVTDDSDLELRLDLSGGTWLSLRMDGEFRADPYPATAARMLHTAARARSLLPGLHRITDVGLAWGESGQG
jgi:4-hydroxy-tetrahydrodipicolinate reductase